MIPFANQSPGPQDFDGAQDFKAIIRKFEEKDALLSTVAFLVDWALIVIAVLMVKHSLWLLPPSLLIVGSRQRALSNLVHDAAHGNLFQNKKINRIVTNCLAALPMFETTSYYQKTHMAHHRFLGDLAKDPDTKNHLRYGYDNSSSKQSGLKTYIKLLLNSQSFRDSVVGSFMSINVKEKIMVFFWWLAVISIMSLAYGSKVALIFCLFWFGAKATTYHGIRIFAEFLDHTGLKVGSTFDSTRNLPHLGMLPAIFHPHQDTYHLTHHLFPTIPHYHLAAVHKASSFHPAYKWAHHCDSYFWGEHSAIRCWTAKCQGVNS